MDGADGTLPSCQQPGSGGFLAQGSIRAISKSMTWFLDAVSNIAQKGNVCCSFMLSYSFFLTNSSFLTSPCVSMLQGHYAVGFCWGKALREMTALINVISLAHTEKLLCESNLANFMDGINFWDQQMCFGARSE